MALNFLNNGYFAGKVGIGTPSPSYQLTLGGNAAGSTEGLRINDPSNAAYGAHFSFSDTPNEVWIGGITNNTYNSAIGIHREATRAITIDVNSNVGIGTTSPGAKLDIQQTTAGNIISAEFDNLDYTVGNRNAIKVRQQVTAGGSYSAFLGVDKETNNIFLSNDSITADHLVIDTSGNVGIGATSPSKQLQLRGSAPFIRLEEDSASNKRLDLWVDPTSAIAYIGANQSAQQLSFQTGNSDRIRILNNGNVGIGDTGPNVKLQVSTSSPTNNVAVSIGDGWVGNSSYHKEGGLLLVSGTSQDTTQTGAGIAFQTRNTENTNYWKSSMIMDRDGAIRFTLGGSGTAAGSEDFTILSNGNVGIGTTSPANKLDVVGTIYSTNIRLGSNASGEGIIRHYSGSGQGIGITTGALNSSGIGLYVSHGSNNRNVGIGTTSPTAKLHVAGTGLFTGLVSGITPVAAANFVTKAYVDAAVVTDINQTDIWFQFPGTAGTTSGRSDGWFSGKTLKYTNFQANFDNLTLESGSTYKLILERFKKGQGDSYGRSSTRKSGYKRQLTGTGSYAGTPYNARPVEIAITSLSQNFDFRPDLYYSASTIGGFPRPSGFSAPSSARVSSRQYFTFRISKTTSGVTEVSNVLAKLQLVGDNANNQYRITWKPYQ